MTRQQQAYEERFAALFRQKARECQNSTKDGVRTLRNPNKVWSHDSKSGRRADAKALACRAEIIVAIKNGARTMVEIRVACKIYGERTLITAKDNLIGERTVFKNMVNRRLIYTLADGSEAA